MTMPRGWNPNQTNDGQTYFGTKNLDQATETAKTAISEAEVKKVEANQAKNEAKEKNADLKVEKRLMIEEINKADRYYEIFDKLTDPSENDKKIGELIQQKENTDLETFNDEIKTRTVHLKEIKMNKQKELDKA